VKLGLSIGYSGARLRLPVDLIKRAEDLGYSTVWCGEAYGSDVMTSLAFIAAHTKKIRLGSSIAQLDARTPANLAMCAQSIDELAGGGRMVLGIGTSGPQIVEGWYGQPWGKANPKLRDTVAIVRKILRREGPVTHDGKAISLPYRGENATGIGKPLKSILHGNPNIPILLGTDTDLNVRMTAEIADGWIALNLTPSAMPHFKPLLEEGLARRTDGKQFADFEIRTNIGLKITDDVRTALQQPKASIALYVGGMGSRELNFHKLNMVRRGYGEAADRIQELYLAGHKAEAEAAVPDEFVEENWLVGTPERIKAAFRPWRDCGITAVAIQPGTPEELELAARIVMD
jgi:F420-dependent oxidoreductase-like protein